MSTETTMNQTTKKTNFQEIKLEVFERKYYLKSQKTNKILPSFGKSTIQNGIVLGFIG